MVAAEIKTLFHDDVMALKNLVLTPDPQACCQCLQKIAWLLSFIA